MKTLSIARHAVAAACLAAASLAQTAHAATHVVTFSHLVESATVAIPLLVNDVLFLNTFVPNETGALSQIATFTVGAGVGNVAGSAAWEVSVATGPGPRLTGVNIDIFDSANNLVVSDGGVLTNNGFATSSFASAIGPGTYRLVATGTGVRESSLDVSLAFTSAVPEPSALAMALAGVGALGFVGARRRRMR